MSKESDRNWLRKHAALEDGGFVSVGGFISTLDEKVSPGEEPVVAAALKHAFVKLVQLKRRERTLSVEELAAKADLDIAELFRIESDEAYIPAPFSVQKLAEFFKLPERPFMALAGLLEVKDLSSNSGRCVLLHVRSLSRSCPGKSTTPWRST